MTTQSERACLQAAIDYLSLTPKEAADWAPKIDSPWMRAMRGAAVRVLRERIHDLHIEPEHEGWPVKRSAASANAVSAFQRVRTEYATLKVSRISGIFAGASWSWSAMYRFVGQV